jgi:hypothetical protein
VFGDDPDIVIQVLALADCTIQMAVNGFSRIGRRRASLSLPESPARPIREGMGRVSASVSEQQQQGRVSVVTRRPFDCSQSHLTFDHVDFPPPFRFIKSSQKPRSPSADGSAGTKILDDMTVTNEPRQAIRIDECFERLPLIGKNRGKNRRDNSDVVLKDMLIDPLVRVSRFRGRNPERNWN